MTLRTELDILRGRPMDDKPDVASVPCIETSDTAQLCKAPVVSVCMLAYNHEPFIGAAIESAVNQVTDFSYEIVIAEDCSKDRTREICLAYQRKYPDKVRVLWSETNLFKVGGNITRLFHKARGEYFAILEGDDCWLDDHKLQKQVDVMRECPRVGLCIGGGVRHNVSSGEDLPWLSELFSVGEMKGRDVCHSLIFTSYKVTCGTAVLTASAMMRATIFRQACERFEPFNWVLAVGDSLWWLGVASLSDVYCCPDQFAQYNIHGGSASANAALNLDGDAAVVKAYFARILEKKQIGDLQPVHRYMFVNNLVRYLLSNWADRRAAVAISRRYAGVFPPTSWILPIFVRFGILNERVVQMFIRANGYLLLIRRTICGW